MIPNGRTKLEGGDMYIICDHVTSESALVLQCSDWRIVDAFSADLGTQWSLGTDLLHCATLFCLFSIVFGYWQEMAAFGWTIVLGGIPAFVVSKWFREPAVYRAEAMCVVALTRLSAVISGIPYVVAGRLAPVDALFESCQA